MNCAPTLTADEFKTLHNGLWELDRMVDKLLHGNVYEGQALEKIAQTLRSGLKGAYQQDQLDHDAKSAHYASVRQDLGIKESQWSMYQVADLNCRHPWSGVDRVEYVNHWGDRPVVKSINGLTWAALWVAANACIRDSGDEHHVYIEDFTRLGNALILQTGS